MAEADALQKEIYGEGVASKFSNGKDGGAEADTTATGSHAGQRAVIGKQTRMVRGCDVFAPEPFRTRSSLNVYSDDHNGRVQDESLEAATAR